ncbi:hypothetical protein CC86DRAFT_460395 [Ophiobolus disseminans]|uniref:Heterokaryon incompatibility domain-containing protein n=1 Tax=Ophiobolus disseminans TaxID=1469910 RepID=A0A6A6ZFZ1_9PLEO|nr:hypothetical protein CC86DRAFT_460395 [Ophiobolus disseminans]
MADKFTTVSYCAGDPKKTEVVVVNGLPFNAFGNLGHALRQARHYWKKIHGDEESLLDASGGLGWLYDLSRIPPGNGFEFQLRKYLKLSWQDEKLHHAWNAFINTILESQWWARAWVRQEFLRSQHAVFLASRESMGWKDFLEVEKGVRRLLNMRYDILNSPERSIDLFSSLEEAHFCKASDPRDLIYAFLGLSQDHYGIVPQYAPEIILSDIIVRLFRNVILQKGSLNILRKTYQVIRSVEEVNTPSWVPNWFYGRSVGRSVHSSFHACGERPNVPFVAHTFREDDQSRQDRIIQARGKLLEVLESKIVQPEDISHQTQFCTDGRARVSTEGPVVRGDEIWLLHGTEHVFIFRRVGICHQVVGEMLEHNDGDDTVMMWIEDFSRLVKNNDPSIEVINIC